MLDQLAIRRPREKLQNRMRDARPDLSTRSSSSAVAFIIASIDPNSCASSSAVRSPTNRMPAHQHARQPAFFEFSISLQQFS